MTVHTNLRTHTHTHTHTVTDKQFETSLPKCTFVFYYICCLLKTHPCRKRGIHTLTRCIRKRKYSVVGVLCVFLLAIESKQKKGEQICHMFIIIIIQFIIVERARQKCPLYKTHALISWKERKREEEKEKSSQWANGVAKLALFSSSFKMWGYSCTHLLLNSTLKFVTKRRERIQGNKVSVFVFV